MTDLVFDCIDAQPERYAAVPTLQLKLRISETTGERVHAITLRCQIRIEPQRRRYSSQEADGLLELFGETQRWGDTLKPMQIWQRSAIAWTRSPVVSEIRSLSCRVGTAA